jgi:peptidylprolyl isomerase
MEPSKPKGLLFSIIGVIGLAVVIILVVTLKKDSTPIDSSAMQPLETATTTIESPLSEPTTPAQNADTKKKIMNTVTLKTNMGTIVIKMDTENTPNTAKNFTDLASKGFYNGTRFHRVISGFMIQGGDPQSADIAKKSLWGTGGPGYQFADEIKPTNSNARGTISMANAGPNTNGSQFFINLVDNSFLNTKHTVFGTVTQGMDIVDKIAKTPVGPNDQPVSDVIIEKVTVE